MDSEKFKFLPQLTLAGDEGCVWRLRIDELIWSKLGVLFNFDMRVSLCCRDSRNWFLHCCIIFITSLCICKGQEFIFQNMVYKKHL